jgi:hypothetical protein
MEARPLIGRRSFGSQASKKEAVAIERGAQTVNPSGVTAPETQQISFTSLKVRSREIHGRQELIHC